MFDNSRRSAISTSELGLYSDRSDRYQRNRYGATVKEFVIGIMAVISIILAGIFLYDFTSGASVTGKASQETKHIYILQNTLKKSNNFSKKSTTSSTILSDVTTNPTQVHLMQDRSDDERDLLVNYDDSIDKSETESGSQRMAPGNPEYRAINLANLQNRKAFVDSEESDKSEDETEGKESLDNHALIHRIRQRYKNQASTEDINSAESRPAPFHFELKTPKPNSFKRSKYPQLSQYRYPQTSRNIQDIIKYLTTNSQRPNRAIKFTGVYVNPKKYDLVPEVGESTINSEGSEEYEDPPYTIGTNSDPFYPYKPQHPADVNLLATSNFRFSPTGIHRHNRNYDPFFPRPQTNFNKHFPAAEVANHDSSALYTSFSKKRKAKPISIMLDIYPITDAIDQPKKSIKPKLLNIEDFDPRRPIAYNNRRGKFYNPSTQPIPILAVPAQQEFNDDEERQHMIFHLNLYPRKRNKLNRHEILERSKSMDSEDGQSFMDKIMTPLDSIAKQLTDHSAIEDSKFEESDMLNDNDELLLTSRYQESTLNISSTNDTEKTDQFPCNHKITEISTVKSDDFHMEEVTSSTTSYQCYDCNNSTSIEVNDKNNETSKIVDIDTVQGFQQFANGLLLNQ